MLQYLQDEGLQDLSNQQVTAALNIGMVEGTMQSLEHITGKRSIQAISQPAKTEVNVKVPALR